VQYSWRHLNRDLSEMTESQVKDLLDQEMVGLRRVTVIERLHQRYNALRISRERAELLEGAAPIADAYRSSNALETQEVLFVQGVPDKKIIPPQTLVPQNCAKAVEEVKPAGTLPTESAAISDNLIKLDALEVGPSRSGPAAENIFTEHDDRDITNEPEVRGEPFLPPGMASGAVNQRLPISLAIPDLEKRNEEAVFDALNKFEKRCPYCGKEQYRVGIRDKIEIDHFVPISKGGQDVPWNLIPVCKECNRRKRDRLPSDFLQPAVLQVVSTYLANVKKNYFKEGYDSYVATKKIVQLIKEHEYFIKNNSSSDFVRELVHLVCIEEAGHLLMSPVAPEVLDGELPEEGDEALIEKLAGMAFLDYHRARATYSKRLRIKPGVLDGLVAASRRNSSNLKQYGAIVDMVKGRLGIFSSGVVGSPFANICASLSAGRGFNLSAKALFSILDSCGWKDMGRLKSREYNAKKHIFCAPEIASAFSKSELRRMLENNERGRGL